MKGLDPILSAVVLADGALVDANLTKVDMGGYPLNREFALSGKIVPNTTAPGASKALTLNWYWSDDDIATPATNVPLLLPYRKFTTGPILLPNLTLANNGERRMRFHPCEVLPALTITPSTVTATLTFLLGYNPKLNVGDMVTIFGGTVTGDGAQMQGTYPIVSVTTTAGLVTATYTITSTSGTLVGATVVVERSVRRGLNEQPNPTILRPVARYMYVSVDRPALTTNATTTLTVGMQRIPGLDINL